MVDFILIISYLNFMPFFIFKKYNFQSFSFMSPISVYDTFFGLHNTPVLRIDNQQNFKIMKISIVLKSFISVFYIIRYIL